MNASSTSRAVSFLLLTALLAVNWCSAWAQTAPVRKAAEDVNDPEVRARPGLRPNANLLFNGWGVTPSGDHLPISDMALKMLIAPDKKILVAVSGGFRKTGLTLVDLAARSVTQFLPLPEAWNGLAFSRDGRRIFVSGGDSGKIHVFNYADGQATADKAVSPCRREDAHFWLESRFIPATARCLSATRPTMRCGS